MTLAQMNNDRLPAALRVLQWTLGLVILAESARFAFSAEAGRTFARTGLPEFVHYGLAGLELAAVILFLIPRVLVAGGRLLIVVLVVAIAIHLLHGWFDVGALVVYAVSAWAVMAGKSAAAEQR